MIEGYQKKFLVTVFLLLISAGVAVAQQNLINNGNFEIQTGDFIDYWGVTAWKNQEGTITAERTPGGKSGAWAVRLSASEPDDAKLVQSVPVEPNTLYRLSGWIGVVAPVEGDLGANLSTMETMETTADVKNPKEGWVFRTLYGKTGPDQRNLTVTLRLGG